VVVSAVSVRVGLVHEGVGRERYGWERLHRRPWGSVGVLHGLRVHGLREGERWRRCSSIHGLSSHHRLGGDGVGNGDSVTRGCSRDDDAARGSGVEGHDDEFVEAGWGWL
jgi:hypothetical protein